MGCLVKASAVKESISPNFLKLRPDVLACPNQLDLEAIKVQMTWPNNTSNQLAAYLSIAVRFGYEKRDNASAEDMYDFMCIMHRSQPLEEVNSEFLALAKRALLAGQLLYNVVGYSRINLSESMEWHIRRIIKPFANTRDRLELKTFQNQTWKNYRCVAHLWAAAYKAMHFHCEPFPCAIDRLGGFLADAEAHRLAGEKLRTKRSPNTVLNPTQTIKFPAALNIEPTALEIEAICAA
jgi:hypothetical protein